MYLLIDYRQIGELVFYPVLCWQTCLSSCVGEKLNLNLNFLQYREIVIHDLEEAFKRETGNTMSRTEEERLRQLLDQYFA